MTLIESWRDTWRALGAAAADEDLFQRLVACYSEPDRSYHSVQHLAECFEHLQELRSSADRPAEVALALWFHDAVYDPKAGDNEDRSAEWARRSALAGGVPAAAADRIAALVMVTKHDAVPQSRDARVVVDADLAILGAEPARFEEYERQVREEYAWVPEPLYRRERAKVPAGFLDRAAIYSTERFRALREPRARENIDRSLARLR
ncbi:MAG: N-methyl-D-aspartate receptor NMDAR2C subunit [Gammaproteobacteria bacterium]